VSRLGHARHIEVNRRRRISAVAADTPFARCWAYRKTGLSVGVNDAFRTYEKNGGPEQPNPPSPSKLMVMNNPVVADEGETGVPPTHAMQTTLTLRTKAAGRCLIVNLLPETRLTEIIRLEPNGAQEDSSNARARPSRPDTEGRGRGFRVVARQHCAPPPADADARGLQTPVKPVRLFLELAFRHCPDAWKFALEPLASR
jgi:hypothetical protein